MNSIITSLKIYRQAGYHFFLTVLVSFVLSLNNSSVFAQMNGNEIRQRLETANFLQEVSFVRADEIVLFYKQLQYQPVWLPTSRFSQIETLLSTLQESDQFGLNQEDYQFRFLQSLKARNFRLPTKTDSLDAELRFTDAALHFFSDLAYGNQKPFLGYSGFTYLPSCYSIPALVAEHIIHNKLKELPNRLSEGLPELLQLQRSIRKMNIILTDSNFQEVRISSNKTNLENIPLLIKLYQLGITDSANKKISEPELKEKVKEAQRQFNLLADGTLRSTSLVELNIPLSTRIQQLQLSLNYYRWLSCITQQQPTILVNIPATNLKVYYQKKILLEMRIIAGKPYTSTPTLSSMVNEVILYPYWHVPFSIATKELLPLIKRNPAFIDANNYQVLNDQGKIMDPYAVPWHLYNTGYFPLTIRQSTGCDNALGLIKFNFYNPFSVYLHDTPGKTLFTLNKRFFSHGCMRLEKPMELGHLILKNNPIAIDTLEQKGCIRNQRPVVVPVPEPMPVIVWYNPVGVDISGRPIFYEDVYKKFSWKK